MSRSCVALVLALCCLPVDAQIQGGSHQTIQTVAGALKIHRADRGFDVLLGESDAQLGHLSGGRYVYYTDEDRDGKRQAASRVVMADFNGGFGEPPTIMLYDLRSKPPVARKLAKRLNVDTVIWQSDAFLLRAEGKWYKYEHNQLALQESFRQTLR